MSYKRPIVCVDTGEVCQTYAEYLKSDHWKRMKQKMRKVKNNQFCFICRKPNNLHVHHKTYENLGNEHTKELMFLCSECHEEAHERLRCPTYKKETLKNVARILMREHKKAATRTAIKASAQS